MKREKNDVNDYIYVFFRLLELVGANAAGSTYNKYEKKRNRHMKKTILAGTYTEKGSRGIYAFGFDNGRTEESRLFAELKDPKYISVHNGLVASVGTFDGGSGAAVLDADGHILDRSVFEKTPSCYITWHGNRLYCANYHEGHFNVLEFDGEKLHHIRTVEIREKAGCHQVIATEDRIYVPCLFLDCVKMYDHNLNPAGEIRFAEGTGPRHGVIAKQGTVMYLVSELSNELFEIRISDHQIMRQISVLPEGKTHLKDTAAIRLSEDETKIYISTRTLDIITVVDAETFEVLQIVPCGGSHPRDIYRCGNYLLSANRFTDNICVFALNPDGTIGEKTGETAVIQAVSLDELEG